MVFDEAQHLSIECLETIRELLDQPPHCGLLFAGTHELEEIFARQAFTVETTSAPNLASRSKIRKRCGCALHSQASCSCRTTRNALGLRVTLQCKIRRRSWLMMKKQYRTPNVSGGAAKDNYVNPTEERLPRHFVDPEEFH